MINVLIVKLSAIGDVVHTLPAVELLRRHFPGCTITWVVEEKAANLLQGYYGIDRLIVSERARWLKDLHDFKLVDVCKGLAAFIRELRAHSYDIVIDFQGLLKSGFAVWLARGKRKIGYANAREGSKLFYNEKAPSPEFNAPAIKRHMGLINYLGVEDSPIFFQRLFSKDDEENIDRLYDHSDIDRSKPIVALHPSAAWSTKCWSQEKTAKLCDMLPEEFGCQIILVGAAEDRKYLEYICSRAHGRVINMAGKTTLRQLACILSKSDLMISMDSGPMHLACAIGIPVVALFGPTAPWRTGPFGEDNTVIRKTIPCSPCFQRKKCPEGHHRCMEDISVEDVFEACGNYLVKDMERRPAGLKRAQIN